MAGKAGEGDDREAAGKRGDRDRERQREEGPPAKRKGLGMPRVGTAGKAAAGLTAAAAAAYAVYLLGAGRGRRRPATELANALGMRIEYVPWGDVHYAYYARDGKGHPGASVWTAVWARHG